MAHQSIFGPKASILEMVNLVSCLCHELSAKELWLLLRKKMGLRVSKHGGRAQARKSIELVAETGPEVHKRVVVQLANRLTHDKITKVLKDQEELIGETKSLTVRNLENSADLERKARVLPAKRIVKVRFRPRRRQAVEEVKKKKAVGQVKKKKAVGEVKNERPGVKKLNKSVRTDIKHMARILISFKSQCFTVL